MSGWSGRRITAFLLYLPLAGALGAVTGIAALLLMRGQMAGLAGILYALFFYGIFRRMALIWKGELDGRPLWKDIATAVVADVMLAVLALNAAL